MIFYVLVCRECEGDKPPDKWLPIPFDSADNRGRWAAIHREATGHDKWWVHDQPEADTLRDERSFLLLLSTQHPWHRSPAGGGYAQGLPVLSFIVAFTASSKCRCPVRAVNRVCPEVASSILAPSSGKLGK